ncbi:dapper homolog 1 [Hippoglossus stenolepis]|uniref:dapper homolog 1 n=1 Tax=Hippoglossus stenolepis TaxID=195615 RepID=UPI001FAEF91F|nr:dapper homolog 1 [Hippoglossus stenolepis]
MRLSGRCSRDREAVSGLRELEALRQRQEELVRSALEEEEEEEEDIRLLRKRLNCLRRTDAGLIHQLQELDRQIIDLRLDPDSSLDKLESDSRPSSGFFELSEAASLSNSSDSVSSECLCSAADADGRLPSTDERSSCLDWDVLVGGLCDDLSGTVRRSLSAPHPPTLDSVSCDSQSKNHCDLVVQNGSDVYRYPSPLHAVAVQSPNFLQMLGHCAHSRNDGLLKTIEAGIEVIKPESLSLPGSVPAPLVPQSSSWPIPSSSHTQSQKRLDSYIYSLLQRRALPVRTSRPRTSISTEPSKSIQRQASLCVRPVCGSGLKTLKGYELKPTSRAAARAAEFAPLSPPRYWSVEIKAEELETQNVVNGGSGDTKQDGFKMNSSDLAKNQSSSLMDSAENDGFFTKKDMNTSLLTKKSKGLLPPSAVSITALPKDVTEPGTPKADSTPKQPCYPPDPALLLRSPQTVKTQPASPTNSPKPLQADQTEKGDRSVLELTVLGSYSQTQDKARGGGGRSSHMVNTKNIPAQWQNIEICKGCRKKTKTFKVKITTTMKMSRTSEHNVPSEREEEKSHRRSSSKESQLLEDGGSSNIKVSRRAPGRASSSIMERLPVSIPEGRVLDKHSTLALSSVHSGTSTHCYHGNLHHHSHHHHRHHRRDRVMVVAKPKHKRHDYRRLRVTRDVAHDEAFRRTQRRKRRERLSIAAANMSRPSSGQLRSPYSYIGGSDSEYSAECASLFHSTIMDTTEDEKSNYTTNRFGDSESSEEEYVEESTTSSDTVESGAGGGTGGMGKGLNQLGPPGARVMGQDMTPAQVKAFVKIKASHNLKKKILRFRSGSLKLMTTV